MPVLTAGEWIALGGVIVAATGVALTGLKLLHDRSFRQTQKGLSRARSKCPHSFLKLREETGDLEIIPAFHKPPGQFDYICQRCGLRGIYDERVIQNLMYQPRDRSIKGFVESFQKQEQDFEKAVRRYEG